MANLVRVLILVAVFACYVSVAFAVPGTATFYTQYTPSACYGYANQGTMIAAASPALYRNGAACGRRYTIRCTSGTNQTPRPCRSGGTVTVRVVDLCPGCPGDSFDLSREAFSLIANPDAGKINIDYNWV